MSSQPSATVVSLPVPPVVKSVLVPCGPPAAFDAFTRDIHRWWPTTTHALNAPHESHVAFDPHVGGRLFERGADGVEHAWGCVTAWEPPHRLAFTWHVGRSPDTAQQVELRFSAHPGGTRVELVHTGWERLGSEGAGMREQYDRGWNLVFVERFGGYARSG
jgi:uncharacterized protein YndB with AHSA1/START domain